MTIKDSFAKLFIAILAVVIGGGALHAQNGASTIESGTNSATAQPPSQAADTNAPPADSSASNSISGPEASHKNPPSKPAPAARPIGKMEFMQDRQGTGQMEPRWILNRKEPVTPMMEKTAVALTAIIGPVILAFALPLAIVFTVFYFRYRQNKLMHETVRAMIEKGMPVSAEMIAGLNAREVQMNIQGRLHELRPRNRHLLPGLILTGVGLALIYILPEHIRQGGLIILLIGVAFLIVWLVERKHSGDGERVINMPGESVQQMEKKQDIDQQPPKI